MLWRGVFGYALMLLLLCYEVLACERNQATGNLLFGLLFVSSILIIAGILASHEGDRQSEDEDGGNKP